MPVRSVVSHKGTFGRLIVVGGSRRYYGAPLLAAMGALRVGAGLVGLAAPEPNVPILASRASEPIYLPLPHENGFLNAQAADALAQELTGIAAVVVGPGLGANQDSSLFLTRFLEHLGKASNPPKILIDADGLNVLSRKADWWGLLPEGAILTPHPGEMARLTGQTQESDRIELARRWARQFNGILVLKGAHTVVASSHSAAVSPIATPALATAGTGDVLAGVIAGLLAQGVSPYDAARSGVYLHGLAGLRLEERIGSAGVVASDLLTELPIALTDPYVGK